MSTKRSVILLGDPEVNEYGVASEAISPGHLVKGVSTVAKQTGTTGSIPKAVALERDELGAGFDDTYFNANSGAPHAAYASGDTVKVAVFDSGDEATLYLASGENVSEDALLECNGAGLVKAGSTKPIARAMEAVDASSGPKTIRVQFI